MPTDALILTPDQVLLTTLIVRLAVIATMATMLVRFGTFQALLRTERRDWPDRLVFILALGIPLTVGVASRVLLGYDALDLQLAGPFLAGLIAGPYAGAIVGGLVGVPATFNGEVIALAFNIGCGFAGGGLREVCPKESIWHFSPFVFTHLHRHAWTFLSRFTVDWQIVLIAAPVSLEVLRQFLGHRFGHRLYFIGDGSPSITFWVVFATVLSVAIPIKIWNSARIEHKLQEQQKLLMTARIEALSNQINPHFLFNTLNSISSLIRTDPETARVVILKLSGLLRRLLRSQDQFVSLREELSAIDEYLDIECVRFGQRLTVVKDIAADTLDTIVPSLILQPIVENALKHGLSNKVGLGTLTLRSAPSPGGTVIDVIDDGLGMPPERVQAAMTASIGLRNTNERLRAVYGTQHHLELDSTPGVGTRVRMVVPAHAIGVEGTPT